MTWLRAVVLKKVSWSFFFEACMVVVVVVPGYTMGETPEGCEQVLPGSSCTISCKSPWTGAQVRISGVWGLFFSLMRLLAYGWSTNLSKMNRGFWKGVLVYLGVYPHPSLSKDASDFLYSLLNISSETSLCENQQQQFFQNQECESILSQHNLWGPRSKWRFCWETILR